MGMGAKDGRAHHEPGGRVLIVDDDPLLRASVRRILADEGYSVDVARDGREALARVDAALPDLIILDVLMPGMNGRQLLEALRRDVKTQDIPILVMTAVQGIEATGGIAAESVDHVEKPFDVDEFLNKVALALYRAREGQAAGAGDRNASVDGARCARGDTILVAHDDPRLVSALDRALGDNGFTVLSISRASDDLPRLARVLEPRAILLALHLSGAGGGITALLRRLRDDGALARVPILVLARRDETLDGREAEIRALGAEIALHPEAPEAIERVCDFAGLQTPARRSS